MCLKTCVLKHMNLILNNNDKTKEEDVEITTLKKRYISPQERQQIIEKLRLVQKKDVYLEIIDELMLMLKNMHISRRKATGY